MTLKKATIQKAAFDQGAVYPFSLRQSDFEHAMEDIYDFFFDVNTLLLSKGLKRLDDMLRPQALSGLLSDMMTASLARFSRSLVENAYHNGHPDLVLRGKYAGNAVASGEEGVEIKSTNKHGGAVDVHGARNQWMCVFVYEVDVRTEPAEAREPMQFVEVYLAKVESHDFRINLRGALGTNTATLHREGLKKLRAGAIYKIDALKPRS